MPIATESAEAALNVTGMDCASCVSHVEKAAGRVAGVESCRVNLATGRAVVRFDPGRTNLTEISRSITDSGYPAEPEDEAGKTERVDRHRAHAQSWLSRAIVGIALWLPVELLHWIRYLAGGHSYHADWMTWLALATSTIGITYVGWAFYRSAFKALLRGTSNMDTLIAMGASVAYLYSLVALIGHLAAGWELADLYFMEATGLLALISLGHWLEARARDSAGSAIRELLNLAPATAIRIENSTTGEQQQEQVPLHSLAVGDVILVRPGDRVAIDGVVIEGRSSIDESMISGEPLPVTRSSGDGVIGGTQNIDGALKVRVSKVGRDTALAQIVQLVEHAQSSKPAVQRLADQIAAVFVPSVLLIAIVTAVGWYVWGSVHHWESAHTWGMLAKAVCSVLIIACPCALGIAVPATLMVGTGRGAKRGILIRDINALQTAEKIDTVVLDKTGTITRGKPAVARIESLNGMSEPEILRLAASAEQYSEHPLGKAIVSKALEQNIRLVDPESFTNEPGRGVTAQIEGKTFLVGSENWLLSGQATSMPASATINQAALAVIGIRQSDGRIERLGNIIIVDELKVDSSKAIAELHSMGLRTVLLSGDRLTGAKAIADRVGIEDVRAEVKPDQKAAAIVELQNHKSQITNLNSVVAMVGDGINDAPALAQADLGIAIGSGSDIAKETGDIVLVGGSLHGIATAIRLSRATMRKIRQNLFFAFIYNVLAIPLAALGLLNPLVAAAAMALSDVTVIGNALLLRRSRID